MNPLRRLRAVVFSGAVMVMSRVVEAASTGIESVIYEVSAEAEALQNISSKGVEALLGFPVLEGEQAVRATDNDRRRFEASGTTAPVPENPFLADSVWPTPHRTGYCQGSSHLPAVNVDDVITCDILRQPIVSSNPITMLYSADNRYIWASSWTTVFKVDRSGPQMEIVSYVPRDHRDFGRDLFHGAYSVLSRENVFFTTYMNRIEAYYDDPILGASKIVKHPIDYSLPPRSDGNGDEDFIRALCMTYDGYLAYATVLGRVGIITRHLMLNDYQNEYDILQLGSEQARTLGGSTGIGELQMSNNIACDVSGAIYVITDQYLHKLDVVHDSEAIPKLRIAWEVPYSESRSSDGSIETDGPAPRIGGRLGKGSGSTPSIFGDADNGLYVAITDDSLLMNLVVIDAENGGIVDRHPVTYGRRDITQSASEQSVLVNGWRLVVVNNTPENDMASDAVQSAASATVPADEADGFLPVVIGSVARGVEQFEFNHLTRKLRSTWANEDLAIPNGIPTMSSAEGLMYGVGKRFLRSRGPLGPGAFRGTWTVEMIDWWTGEALRHYNIGFGILHNSVYAAAQIGSDREVITGVGGGIFRIKPMIPPRRREKQRKRTYISKATGDQDTDSEHHSALSNNTATYEDNNSTTSVHGASSQFGYPLTEAKPTKGPGSEVSALVRIPLKVVGSIRDGANQILSLEN